MKNLSHFWIIAFVIWVYIGLSTASITYVASVYANENDSNEETIISAPQMTIRLEKLSREWQNLNKKLDLARKCELGWLIKLDLISNLNISFENFLLRK